MITLGILSLLLLLLSIVLITASTKLKEFHQILLVAFLGIQSWFSIQWLVFLGFDVLLGSGFSNDSLGLFLATVSLFLPIGFVYVSKRNPSPKRLAALSGMILFASICTVMIHALISSPCVLCAFTPENLNLRINLLFQLIIDFGLLVGFLFLLFDKEYRSAKNRRTLWSIGSVFAVFYINDLLVIVSRITADIELYSMEAAMWIEVLLYFLFSSGVFYLSLLIKARGNETSIAKPNHHIINLECIDPDWSILKSNLSDPESIELANSIDQINSLTKTEKLYLFLGHFNDIPNKILSELLSVSLRTVETNKYRLKKKLEKEKIEL